MKSRPFKPVFDKLKLQKAISSEAEFEVEGAFIFALLFTLEITLYQNFN